MRGTGLLQLRLRADRRYSPAVDPERLFLEHLELVENVARFIARRHHLTADEAEELSSSVRLKIIENDYEVLRRFEGRSSLRTYLTVIVNRHFLDQRNARWGRWRPSTLARRLGPEAILLDQLVTRDGMSVDDAVSRVQATRATSCPVEKLFAIAAMLPQREAPARMVSDDQLSIVPSSESSSSTVDEALRRHDASRAEEALAQALVGLPEEDRVILKMRFQQGLQVAQIARVMALEQKPLYRRLEALLTRLRHELEAQGVTADCIGAFIGDPAVDFDSLLERPGYDGHQRRDA